MNNKRKFHFRRGFETHIDRSMDMKQLFLICSILTFTFIFSSNVFGKEYFVGEINMMSITEQLDKFEPVNEQWNMDDIKALNNSLNGISFKVFFAEWCHDSQSQVPKLVSLFEQLQLSQENVWFYSLDTKKSDPKNFASQHRITNTPTLIVYHNNKEIGRIKEYPRKTWSTDIRNIIASK